MITNLFSKRLNKQKPVPDVYQYVNLPTPFRHQIVHLWHDINDILILISWDPPEFWKQVNNIIAREEGLPFIGEDIRQPDFNQCIAYLFSSRSIEKIIDIIEISFGLLQYGIPVYSTKGKNKYAELAEELNHRFLEHNIGYQFENSVIIRIDNKHIHAEIIKPALALLSEKIFHGANKEFLSAFEFYHKKNYQQAIVEAQKAFESTMKIICDQEGWSYKPTDPAKNLINIIFEKKLIPDYLISHVTSLRACLESGLPTLRNKTSSHGQGTNVINVPDYYASYAINLAATNIVLLVSAYKNLR